jgi:hypothetical protein
MLTVVTHLLAELVLQLLLLLVAVVVLLHHLEVVQQIAVVLVVADVSLLLRVELLVLDLLMKAMLAVLTQATLS